jgi:GNAT superfamily N-acetyltransferase
MESVLLAMRQMWFAAQVRQLHGGLLVSEPEGEIVTMVNGDSASAAGLIREAQERRAYVVATPFSRPPDLPARLRRAGFHLVHRQGTYLYEGPSLTEADLEPRGEQRRRGLLSWLGARTPLPVEISPVTEADVAAWNRVCWVAFSPRGVSESQSLAEKRRAFRAMGPRSVWYLARSGDRPIGCAILYQGEEAAQVLAVGTLPGFRGRGVATAVVKRAIYDWQQGGWGFLFLDTIPRSSPERLYLALGFRPAYTRQVFAP